MSGGRKRILSLLTWREKRKAWNKTRENYMPKERRRNLAETDKGTYLEAATGSVLEEKVFLEILQNSQENTCTPVAEACNFTKKETLALVFSCEFCEISKNTFFSEQLWATASAYYKTKGMIRSILRR